MFSNRIAIDLGTAYSVITDRSSKDFQRIASSVAIEKKTRKPIAFGDEAKKMIGRCPDHIEIIRPLRDGVITDFEVTNFYLTHLVKKSRRGFLSLRDNVYLCVPWGATGVELRSYIQGLQKQGRKVFLIREPFAAAIGCGLDLFSSKPMTIMDMGGGTTEIATLGDGCMLHATSLRAAGTTCDQLIVDGFRQAYEFELGSLAAEEAKLLHGNVWNSSQDYQFEIKGLERRSHLPRILKASTADLRAFLESFALKVEGALYEHFNALSSDAMDSLRVQGLYLTGGTSLIKAWPERLQRRFGIQVHMAPEPLLSVISGLKKIIQKPGHYKGIVRLSMEFFR